MLHPTVYDKAAESLFVVGLTTSDERELAVRAVNAAAPVLFSLWDVQALRDENARLRMALYAEDVR
jgi:hypothetical protein